MSWFAWDTIELSVSQFAQWFFDFSPCPMVYRLLGGHCNSYPPRKKIVANMVSLRSSCYRFLWGIVATYPFACAKLARALRQPCAKFTMFKWCARRLCVHEFTRNLWKVFAQLAVLNVVHLFPRFIRMVRGAVA